MNELEKIFLEDQALLQLAWKGFNKETVGLLSNKYLGEDWLVNFRTEAIKDGRLRYKIHFVQDKYGLPWFVCVKLEIIEVTSDVLNISVVYEYTDVEKNQIDIHGEGKNYFIGKTTREEVKKVAEKVIDEMSKKYNVVIDKSENPKIIMIHLLLRYLLIKDNEKMLEMKGEE